MCPKSQEWMGGGGGGGACRGSVTLQRGDDYSCIHSVFNQWIKLSIYSSIDVGDDKCLSMLSRRGRRHWRPFNHPSQRWAEADLDPLPRFQLSCRKRPIKKQAALPLVLHSAPQLRRHFVNTDAICRLLSNNNG